MRWTYLLFAGLIFLTSTLVGCAVYKALFKELPLSENYALRSQGSTSNTPWVIDGDLDYGEKTTPLPVIYRDKNLEDDYTGVDVILREAKQIDQIRIYSAKDKVIDHCEIWVHVPGGAEDEWKTVKEVKRNINPILIIHPHDGVYTDQIRVMIRRTRPMSGGTSSGGGGKDGEPFIDVNPVIKEVELYKILDKEEIPQEKEEKS
jgi:hypothetical protein